MAMLIARAQTISIILLLLAACGFSNLDAGEEKAGFRSEALVDFPDDALLNGRTLTAADIDAMMVTLKGLGVRRVSWGYYGDGHGGYLNPTGYLTEYNGGWKHYDATYRALGNPLKVAVEAGHRHGLEVYAYFKPYETGPGVMFPEGSPQAKDWGLLDCVGGKLGWMDPFVREHSNLRIQRRRDDIDAKDEARPITSIRLIKKDAAPTRLTKEHIQLWSSASNFKYEQLKVDFKVADTVEPAAREVRDNFGRVLTRKGDPVRVLTLSGLDLNNKYIVVTTDFADAGADFVNSGLAIMEPLDVAGRAISGVFATGSTVWCEDLSDFRRGGMMFDFGWGAMAVTLDASSANGRKGVIGFARGVNFTLPGALCETEPEVQAFWLKCLDEIIAAGVDGVDFREESHSTHTDFPQDYGFNPAVLEKCKERQGELLQNIAEVRGEAYTEFLRTCKARLAKAGKRMRYNLQLDFFRPTPPAERRLAYPANIKFDWQRWIDEGLMDEAILRFFTLPLSAVFDDAVAKDMIARCQKKGIPICVNRYVAHGGANLSAEAQRVKADGRFSGFIFYETNDYIKFAAQPGACSISLEQVSKAAAGLKP